MLQEGSSPTQVIGAVARHVRQAPGRQMGRQAGGLWTGAWRLGCWGKKTEYPGAETQMPNGELHQTFMRGAALAVPHPGLGWGGGGAEPAASCWSGEGWGGGSLLTDDVKFLGNFQVAPGLEGESWMWKKSDGLRWGEAGRWDREED